ncbi:MULTISPECIES: type II toxin-antitoxin system RelB/DinJ family antitoxin [Psychrobacter]|jgi:addiction module RelB/DinJ family antitoxin|uniref:type II toxin-antitoxin system RelB/DinJ family antitoxin n=1 Tax=Psychrobacter TaxID=497 RepID=UPI001787E15B|nr:MULTISPECIES: type II toxin-antitoxin system RelB/DinJ family antitoxin [Psychrobacter]MBE0443430.1 type II toxin-antitoxin system RelB/DinJ family antitoxin [Psychrobacter sp. FME13]MDN5653273.1 type II toxin-antitoxin system RelB/DinJ family antitoxin [Lactococcus lactis]
MSSTVNFNMRLEKELKDETSQIFENYGMTTSQAVRMFLVNVAKTKKIPLSFDYQADDLVLGDQTLQAIKQGRLDYEAGKLDRLEPNEALEALQGLSRG